MTRFTLATCLAVLAVAAGSLTVQAQNLQRAPNLTIHPEIVPPVHLNRTCKAQAMAAESNVSAADARARWQNMARAAHGTAWENWSLSVSRNETHTQGLSYQTFRASARPCRYRPIVLAP